MWGSRLLWAGRERVRMVAAGVGRSPDPLGVVVGSAALVVGILLGGCVYESEPAPVQRSPAGTTVTPVGELQAMLELFSEEMRREGASAVLIATKVGHEEWSHAVGVRSLDGGVPVQLDDPVTGYLPELEDLLHPHEPLSVRQLLGHTSGIPDFHAPRLESALGQVLSPPISPEQRLALAGTLLWQVAEPGEYKSSSSDYVVLGLLVERLRGRPLAEVLRADVVEPLGLGATHSAVQRGSASGGMISTVQDLNTFYTALLRGGLLAHCDQ